MRDQESRDPRIIVVLKKGTVALLAVMLIVVQTVPSAWAASSVCSLIGKGNRQCVMELNKGDSINIQTESNTTGKLQIVAIRESEKVLGEYQLPDENRVPFDLKPPSSEVKIDWKISVRQFPFYVSNESEEKCQLMLVKVCKDQEDSKCDISEENR